MGQQSEQNNQPAPNTPVDEQQTPEIPATVSVGAELRRAREAAGLGLSEVADRLKLSLRQLDAIERDDFDSLPGATFVRGFVRNYARFLELDPAPLMAALEGHFPSAVHDVANLARHEAAPPPPASESTSMPASRWLVIGLVGVVLGAAAIWVFGHREETSPEGANGVGQPMTQSSASDAAASAPMPLASSAVLASAPVLETSAPAVVPVAVPAVPASAAAAAVKPVVKPAAKAAASQAAAAVASAPSVAGQARVSVSTEEEAWVSIVDANGKKLVFTNLQPGDAREASGTPPFKVRLGNAEKVTLTFNGKPVNFTARIKGTVANLDLK